MLDLGGKTVNAPHTEASDMDTDGFKETKIVDSWIRNATPWTDSVRRQEIESRRLVTDRAIIDVIRQHAPRSVLDIGCGEGWLARALAAEGIEVTGLDVVPELIQKAQQAGGGTFRVASFEDIVAGGLGLTAQLAVCNYSLLGKESVERLLAALPSLLGARGVLVIQTIHPLMACHEGLPYHSGWREETWASFPSQFHSAAPWYFRTLPDWVECLRHGGLQVTQIREPLHPATAKPVSLILVASVPALHDAGA
jgi:2-polyprenyl-3-methyl-5-hydroxy-6-metoxy-1,4-benzoquinol methylase